MRRARLRRNPAEAVALPLRRPATLFVVLGFTVLVLLAQLGGSGHTVYSQSFTPTPGTIPPATPTPAPVLSISSVGSISAPSSFTAHKGTVNLVASLTADSIDQIVWSYSFDLGSTFTTLATNAVASGATTDIEAWDTTAAGIAPSGTDRASVIIRAQGSLSSSAVGSAAEVLGLFLDNTLPTVNNLVPAAGSSGHAVGLPSI